MLTLEQIKLLESKISRAIDFVTEVTEENERLKKQNDELEKTVEKLREEKTRVEEGIVSALGKLNQFEDAIERSLSSVKTAPKPQKAEKSPGLTQAASTPPKPASTQAVPAAPVQAASPQATAQTAPAAAASAQAPQPAVPSAYTVDEELDDEVLEEIDDSGEAELDIF